MSIADEFVLAWNGHAASAGWARCLKMTASRANKLRLRMKDPFWAENWRQALERASQLPFFRGRNDRDWRCTVVFFLRPDSVARILEGEFDRCGKGAARVIPPGEKSAAKLAEMREQERKAAEQAAEVFDLVGGLAEAFTRRVPPVKEVQE